MATLQSALEAIDQLGTTEKWLLLRHLLDDLEAQAAPQQPEDWSAFIERMYGILADDLIERPPQPPLTERDTVD